MLDEDRTPLPPNVRLAPLPPADAIQYLQAKRLIGSFDWRDVWHEEHAYGLTVAKMARLDLLQEVHAALLDAQQQGSNLKTFITRLQPVLENAGWWGRKTEIDSLTGAEVEVQLGSPRRLRTIFDTNMHTAYAAGRWARIERSRATHPYIRYVTMQDERVRASHAAWHGVTLPIDDAFWQTHYPPNGWNCRCTAYGINQRGIDRLREAGEPVITEAPRTPLVEWLNKRTGETQEVPVGIDPGFAWNPGLTKQRAEAMSATLVDKVNRADEALARAHVAEFFKGGEFNQWYRAIDQAVQTARADASLASLAGNELVSALAQGAGRGETRPIAVLPAAYRSLIGAQAQAVELSDATLIKQLVSREGQALAMADYLLLQDVIEQAQMIVKDGERTLVFLQQGEQIYYAVLKTTRSGQAVFLQSYRLSSPADARRIARKGQVLKDDMLGNLGANEGAVGQ